MKLIERIKDGVKNGVQALRTHRFRQFVKDEVAEAESTDLAGLAMGIVTLVIIGAVGLYVASQIFDLVSITSGDSFYTASQTLTSITNTGFSMLLIAVVATLAGVVIAAIMWK